MALFIKTYNMCTGLLSVCTRLILEAFQSQIWYSAEAAGGLGGPGGESLVISTESLGEAWILQMPGAKSSPGTESAGKKWERERRAHTHSAPLLFSFSYQYGHAQNQVLVEGPHSPALPDNCLLAPSNLTAWMREPLAPKQSLRTKRGWGGENN